MYVSVTLQLGLCRHLNSRRLTLPAASTLYLYQGFPVIDGLGNDHAPVQTQSNLSISG